MLSQLEIIPPRTEIIPERRFDEACFLKISPCFMGKYRNIFFSEAITLIEPKLCSNHWKVLYTFCVFYVDQNSKMTTTAGHHFYIGPIGSFYNQVNGTGSGKLYIFRS